MRDLALHILDIAENSLNAGATLVEIEVVENPGSDRLSIKVRDNGRGFEVGHRMGNPFYTTKEGKRFGLGISLFRQAVEQCAGWFSIESAPGMGTVVEAELVLSHIDLMPLGDMGATVAAIVSGNPDADCVVRFRRDEYEYVMDTKRLREETDGLPLSVPQVLAYIKENVNEGIRRSHGR